MKVYKQQDFSELKKRIAYGRRHVFDYCLELSTVEPNRVVWVQYFTISTLPGILPPPVENNAPVSSVEPPTGLLNEV